MTARWAVGVVAVLILHAGLAGPASADAPTKIRMVIDAEVAWLAGSGEPPPAGMFADDAVFSLPDAELIHGGSALWSELAACAPRQPQVGDYAVDFGLDASGAWVSFTVAFKAASCAAPPVYRASELLVPGRGGWRVVAGAWSRGVPDAALDAAAQGGHLAPVALGAGPSDEFAAARLAKLVTGGVDGHATRGNRLVVFGTAPGERVQDGKGFAASWQAAWVGHVAIDGAVIAGTVPDGPVWWAMANLILDKRSGTNRVRVPVRAFVVFAKPGMGEAPSLMHLHLAASTAQLSTRAAK